MRMMVTFSIPCESGNDIVRSGEIAEVFQKLMEDIKPEAAYMYPRDGQRGGHLIINMTDSSEVAAVAERIWFGLKAERHNDAGDEPRRFAEGPCRDGGGS